MPAHRCSSQEAPRNHQEKGWTRAGHAHIEGLSDWGVFPARPWGHLHLPCIVDSNCEGEKVLRVTCVALICCRRRHHCVFSCCQSSFSIFVFLLLLKINRRKILLVSILLFMKIVFLFGDFHHGLFHAFFIKSFEYSML